MSTIQELLHLNIVDCIVVAVILISTLISLVRGFLKEFISLLVWIVGFWVSIQFYQAMSVVLAPYFSNVAIRHIVSFAGIFLLTLLIGALFNCLFSFIIVKSGLSGTDRFLGTIFGCARGVLLVAIVMLIVSSTSFVQEDWWQKSVFIPHLQFIVDWLKTLFPQKIMSSLTNPG
ncbi:MAG: CvpA family protein [Coxiellaceae bacterium]|jgi:membrane protein required for colicin V production|nr:CvpA family protein [Coxiellaceae bacterium]